MHLLLCIKFYKEKKSVLSQTITQDHVHVQPTVVLSHGIFGAIQAVSWSSQDRQSFRPQQMQTSFSFTPSHHLPLKPAVIYKPPEGVMDGSTKYKELYTIRKVGGLQAN